MQLRGSPHPTDRVSGLDVGCGGVVCVAGQHCRAGGACVDDCADAQCPGGAACVDGLCEAPVLGSQGDGGAGGDGPTDPGLTFGGEGPNGSGNGSGEGGVGVGSGVGARNGNGNSGGDGNAIEAKGCSCRAVGGAGARQRYWLALLGLSLLAARRRHSQ